jgi:FtsZ-binding cell division protein ZapB
MTTQTKKPTLKSLQMKVAALSKDLDFYRKQVELRDETITAQREELFELKDRSTFLQEEASSFINKNNALKSELKHYKYERLIAITALNEINNSTYLLWAHNIASGVLKKFYSFNGVDIQD